MSTIRVTGGRAYSDPLHSEAAIPRTQVAKKKLRQQQRDRLVRLGMPLSEVVAILEK